MGIFSGCILASDLDGTLTKDDGTIGRDVVEAIKYFTNNGGYFTVSTGRTKQGFHKYNPELINAPVLLGNGAMAYDYRLGKIAFCNCIDADAFDEFQKIKNGFDDIGIEFYTTDFKSYVINPTEKNINHFKFQFIDYSVVDNVKIEDFPLVKIMVNVDKNRCEDFMKFLDGLNLKKIKYIPQHSDFIEIISVKTDKGIGLLKLAEVLNVNPKHIYSIGNGSNDISMLKAATIGFVPVNGDESAREVADVFVRSNNDGAVADAIYKIEEMMKQENK